MIRQYESRDCPVLAQLFFEAVHAVKAYTSQQLWAWATGTVDLDAWNQTFFQSCTLVAELDGKIVGFANMDATGYLDRLFVHKDHWRQGIGTALCDALEQQSPAQHFFTHASIAARPFFEKRGYRVINEQKVQRNGVFLTNFVMGK